MIKQNISLVAFRIQSFSENEILGMIDKNTLEEIKTKDPHPFFQLYSICHEGESRPKIVGETNRPPMLWTRKAIQSIAGVIKKGINFFLGHNADNSTENRDSFGEIVGYAEKEIKGNLHSLVVGYFPPDKKEEAKKLDICSQEGTWNFIEQAGKLVADSIQELTGIALSNSENDTPAFAEAKRLGVLQCFENTGDVNMTFEEVKKAVKDMNIFAWQLYSIDDMKKDKEFGKHLEELENLKKDSQVKEQNYAKDKKEWEDKQKEYQAKDLLYSASDRYQKIAKDKKLTDKEQLFMDKLFKKGNIADMSDDGLSKFIDINREIYKEAVSTQDKDQSHIQTQTELSDKMDYSNPANNPLLDKAE